jgi:hypothetical protein
MRRARLAIAVALLALPSCGDDRACTLIGCDESSAQVRLSGLPRGAVEVRVCVDDRCHTASVLREGSVASVRLEHELGDRARMVVDVRRRGRVIARGAAEVPVKTSRPNGPDCPPVCRLAAARLDVASGRLEPG